MPLARRLGFVSLLIYGIGNILGAGIYALVGKVAEVSSHGIWLIFLLAALMALLTGISYAELSSRSPVAAGAVAFVKRAFQSPMVATLTGVFVLGTGLASAATITVAFSAYLQKLIIINDALAKIILVSSLCFLSFWGIKESSRVNILFTFIEVCGLIAVIVVGVKLINLPILEQFSQSPLQGLQLNQIGIGMALAFYAYIGFEDLSNLAEESKNPSRDIPRVILISIVVSTVLYTLVALCLVLNVPPQLIHQSTTPLLLVFQQAGIANINTYFSLVALLAISNTGLINLIMASRLLYGMSEENLLPAWIGKVHPTRQTPWVAVLLTYGFVILLVFTGGIKILAQTTSLMITTVFLMVHLSLIKLKLKKAPPAPTQFPILFPLLGAASCIALLTQFPWQAFARSLIFLAIGMGIWALNRKRPY